MSVNVTHDAMLKHDLHLVLLDVPVCDPRQQAGDASPPRHAAFAAIDQGAAVGRVEALPLLRRVAEELEHLLVRGRAGGDVRQPVPIEHYPRLPRGLLTASGPETHAPCPA